jgi:hypothetical protein
MEREYDRFSGNIRATRIDFGGAPVKGVNSRMGPGIKKAKIHTRTFCGNGCGERQGDRKAGIHIDRTALAVNLGVANARTG